jgi:hypothetical protein
MTGALLGVPSVVLYTGLVLVGFEKDWYWNHSTVSYIDLRQDSDRFVALHQGHRDKVKQSFVRTV